jgi:penicillin-binding protein 2
MNNDPFDSGDLLDLDLDTSGAESEAWQGALKNEEGPEQIARERKGNRSRLQFFKLAIAAVFLLLAGRLAILQIANSSQNQALAEGNRVRETEVRAPRGVIYDANHGLIARNIPNFEVTVVPAELPRKDADRTDVYAKLASALNKPVEEIKKQAESKGAHYGQQVVGADNHDRDASVLLRIRANNLPGVTVQDNPHRQYSDPDLYAHILGYTGRVSEDDLKRNPNFEASDYVGKTGLEVIYEDQLRGKAGKRRMEVNAQGESIKELQSDDPTSG